MGTRVRFDTEPELVRPSLEDIRVTTITEESMLPASTADYSDVSDPSSGSSQSGAETQEKGYEWRSWTLNISLGNIDTIVEGANEFFKTLDKISKVIIQILKIVRLLSGNVKSISVFIQFLIKIVAKKIKDFIDSLASLGLYMSVIMPEIDKKSPKYVIPLNQGFPEFINRVNATCLNSEDPDAPRFFGEQDRVGGVILAMLGGVNDPDFLKSLINNLRIIAQFFGFAVPYPPPPTQVKARAGFFRNRDTNDREMGVRLTWTRPETPVTHFVVYRKESSKNSKPKAVQVGGALRVIKIPGERIHTQAMIPALVKYAYTDFDVESGKTYIYKIYSTYGGEDFFEDNEFLEGEDSPCASRSVSARPRNCIPVSELEKWAVVATNGHLASPLDFNWESDWQSLSVRNLMGTALDGLFDRIDSLADKLTGLVKTGSSATTEFLDFYSKRIEKLLEVIDAVEAIIQLILSFSLQGSFLLLNLPIEEGGMQGFVDRFNEASAFGEGDQERLTNAPDSPFSVDKNAGIADLQGGGKIMFGVILLTGFPGLPEEVVTEDQVASLEKKIKRTEKAIGTLMTILGLEE